MPGRGSLEVKNIFRKELNLATKLVVQPMPKSSIKLSIRFSEVKIRYFKKK